ncbi:MAG: carboxy terminal-processing peptidase [Myxococcota bacterium]|nr:carboxy terminal-processing peptidase [Myxococcota bacterium]
MHIPRRLPLAAGLALLLVLPAPAARAGLTCGDIADITTLYFQKHISHRQLSDELRERTADNLLKRLDPQGVLYLAAEAETLRQSLIHVFSETQSGDCSRLRKLQQDLIARHGELEGFVRGFVGSEDYVLDTSVSLVRDPDKRERPKTKPERDALLRTLVHFQISTFLAAGTEEEEARERLIHRYELNTKRAREMTRDDLYASFLDGFANGLDPHSNFLSADVLEDFQINMRLSLEGIGVALSERDGYSVVEEIIPFGAAARLDVLRKEDRIIAVAEDGEEAVDVIDMRLRDVVRLIRGKKGTKVRLTVLRQDEGAERFDVVIERDTIDLAEQAAQLRVEEVETAGGKLKLGVLELPSFYGDRDQTKRQGSRDVARLLVEAREKKLDGIVLDLSRNGGGLLDDAVRISGFFIQEGGVVAIRGEGERARVLSDPDDGVLWNGPLVVLTSRVSASASEILAGALKDYRRAVIVGDDHTFGKGTVQSVYPLRPQQGAIKVTTALFYRPGGISTQHDGVGTDVLVPSLFNHDDFGERTLPHSLQAKAIAPFAGRKANGEEKDEQWTPVTDAMLGEIVARSQARVAEDAFFQEVESELAERAEDNGVVVLSELLEEREQENREDEESGANDATESGAEGGAVAPGTDTASTPPPKAPDVKPGEADAEGEDELSPQAKEALQILADLVQLTS